MRTVLLTLLLVLSTGSVASVAFAGKTRTYTIEAGDTPGGVAKRFGVPLDELLRFNGLGPSGPFRVGQTLKIPKKGQVTGSRYTVKPGDSVAKVADFHGVSQDDLRRANRMGRNAKLRPGQEIEIPMTLRGGATRSHVIKKGDTLSSIAATHDVSVKRLRAKNKLKKGSPLELGRVLIIPDDEDDEEEPAPVKSSKLVESGEKIPGGVRHTVQPGQSIWIIARAYNVKGERIAEKNGIETSTPLTVGQKIIVPGAKKVVPVRVKGFVVQPVHFVRVHNDKSITVRLLTRSGKVNGASRKKLSKLSGPRKKGQGWKLFHKRIIHMLQRVAERWPGKTIDIVSGYRPGQTGSESRHSQGRAVDFRVRGVSNEELYEFCTGLPKSGCGYYPNSVFVHMDARDQSATWTDYSAPGEKARYSE